MSENSDHFTTASDGSVNIPSNEMIEISMEDVPEYLQHGDFFQSLNEEDDESIRKFSVPTNCLKSNEIVVNYIDFHFLLRSLRFWLVADIPWTAEEFLFSSCDSNCIFEIDEYFDYLPKRLIRKLVKRTSAREVMIQALKKGSLSVVNWLLAENHSLPSNAFYLALMSGNLKCVQLAYTSQMGLKKNIGCIAILSGSLECLKYIHSKGHKDLREECCMAANCGNIEILRYLHQQQGSILIEETAWCAARSGSVPCLQYLHEHGCPWDYRALVEAAREGQVASMQYLCEHGCVRDKRVGIAAARAGQLNSLEFLQEQGYHWHRDILEAAVGHPACFQYLVEHGCPWDAAVLCTAILYDDPNTLQYVCTDGCPWSAKVLKIGMQSCCKKAIPHHSMILLLKYLVENGFPVYAETMCVAARKGSLESIQYLHSRGCAWGADAASEAAGGGHLSCLKYLCDHGCIWGTDTVCAAAAGGSVECLQYLHRRGCMWDTSVTYTAAMKGQLNCLKYLHAHGCPWDHTACTGAVRWDQVDCMRYLYKHGCPCVFIAMERICTMYYDSRRWKSWQDSFEWNERLERQNIGI